MSQHARSASSIPLFEGQEFQTPSVVAAPACPRPTSPERCASRQRSSRVLHVAAECDDPLAPPPRRGSRSSLGIGAPAKAAGTGAAPMLGRANSSGSGARMQQQLLPGSAEGAVAMKADGHRATATLGSTGISITYDIKHCCIPTSRAEHVPFSEVLSAELLPPATGMWRLPGTRLHRLVIWTFRRGASNPAAWFPRQLVLETASEGVLDEWQQRISAAVAREPRRPRRLLVFVNPFGGSRRAAQIWQNVVKPVFDKAGIKSSAVETQHGGHARSLLTNMPGDELAGYDGVVAIGGDGLFHEIINGLLELRSVPAGTSLDKHQWAELQAHLEEAAAADAAAAAVAAAELQRQGGAASAGAQQAAEAAATLVKTGSFGLPGLPGGARHMRGAAHRRTGSIAASLRVGHIPAGSTDAVACTLNGTRSAFTAAMHIALGDGCPLDVLRIDSANGHHAFATCMVSYGFMGDVMAESENYRWLGPLRYDMIGTKMLAANRSYRARISYLPAEPDQLAAAGKVCTAGCDLCRLGREHIKLQNAFREASTRSLTRRRSEWVHIESEFAGIMLVIMPCRSEKSVQGVAKYGHRSDGLIHLVMVKKCSRLQYLRFLLTLSNTGLAAGEHGFFTVVPAVAVHVEPVGGKESHWNADGELLPNNHITAEVHRGVIEVFARGVEVGPSKTPA
ncbi:hypothetical protein ABPG75_000183 [Micractinium tetrahymenae]